MRVVLLALAAVLCLSACGRKAPLEVPPSPPSEDPAPAAAS